MGDEINIEDLLNDIHILSLKIKEALEQGNKYDVRDKLQIIQRENLILYLKAQSEKDKELIKKQREIAVQIEEIERNKDNSKKCIRNIDLIIQLTAAESKKITRRGLLKGLVAASAMIATRAPMSAREATAQSIYSIEEWKKNPERMEQAIIIFFISPGGYYDFFKTFRDSREEIDLEYVIRWGIDKIKFFEKNGLQIADIYEISLTLQQQVSKNSPKYDYHIKNIKSYMEGKLIDFLISRTLGDIEKILRDLKPEEYEPSEIFSKKQSLEIWKGMWETKLEIFNKHIDFLDKTLVVLEIALPETKKAISILLKTIKNQIKKMKL